MLYRMGKASFTTLFPTPSKDGKPNEILKEEKLVKTIINDVRWRYICGFVFHLRFLIWTGFDVIS